MVSSTSKPQPRGPHNILSKARLLSSPLQSRRRLLSPSLSLGLSLSAPPPQPEVILPLSASRGSPSLSPHPREDHHCRGAAGPEFMNELQRTVLSGWVGQASSSCNHLGESVGRKQSWPSSISEEWLSQVLCIFHSKGDVRSLPATV